MLRMARHVHQQTGQKNLVLAGGCALNCVANGRILRESPFEKIWIQPAAGDAGGALGSALFAWYQFLDNKREADNVNDFQRASYLGPEFSDEKIAAFLSEAGAAFKKVDRSEIPRMAAELINSEKVIGWFQGRMEFGPRALGSRSIIGDSRSKNMQSIMNLKIKFRESFRPFAPSVLVEHVSDYFAIDRESPYMLLVAPVLEEKRVNSQPENNQLFGVEKLKVPRSVIPAITHVDYSARIQTVDKKNNGLYYDMIKEFHNLTGCPVIINTSFNVRGEPIVCSPKEAYTCFMRTEMDYLIMGSYILDKQKQPALSSDIDWKKEFELD